MAKGPVLTYQVKRIIFEEYEEHPELRWKPKKFHKCVYDRVHRELPTQASPGWPGLSVIKARLRKLVWDDENRSPESKGRDRPWDVFSLAKYPIPPDALPAVFRMWGWVQDKYSVILSIREAQWAARLSRVIEAVHEELPYKDRQMAYLWVAVRAYAATEMMREVTGEDVDAGSAFDLHLWAIATGEQISPHMWERFLSNEGQCDMYFALTKEEHESALDAVGTMLRLEDETTKGGQE